MLSFTFDGKNSFIDYGIVISKRPNLPSPKRRVHYMDIPGRHGRVQYDEKTYEDITIVVECGLKDTENLVERLDAIKAWLFNAGESDLVFSFGEDKKYIAQVVNAIDFTQVYKYTSSFPVIFNCHPFKYEVENEIITLNETDATVHNPGSLESEPVIYVYGSGDILLNINDQSIGLNGVEGKIILNSEIQDCYDDAMNNLNSKMVGEFPLLKTGENTITWSGNVTKLEVLPNWRWL
ncbi:putative phage tail component-like protein [Desulfitispora alkaliphila]|uniref:distal tail protein Dit n=1 Tax=Desulfitispora alkaliphila TaxID=622674 RepID=UPI003D214534